MKILNRPMFRMGGPIKEGIMSGIKEPRQKYQEAGQVFKNVQSVLQDGTAADSAVLNEAAKLGIGNPFRIQEFKPYMRKTITQPTNLNMSETDQLAAEVERIEPAEGLTELQKAKLGKTFIGTQEYRDKVKELEAAENFKSNADGTVITGGKSPFEYTVDEVVETKGKNIVDNEPAPINQKEKVNTILESLGYDRAQKNALYDAMIKAGQRISRGGLGAENLVSDIISETSQSYDKPEKLREAANLMDTQQQLKLEQIEAGKSNQMEESVNYLMSADGGGKSRTEALDIVLKNPRSGGEAFYNAYKEIRDPKKAVDRAVEWSVSRGEYEEPIGRINDKEYKTPDKFFKSKDFKGPGNYILKGTIFQIDAQGNATKIEQYYDSKGSSGFLGFGGDK